jgi:hypothetical protein
MAHDTEANDDQDVTNSQIFKFSNHQIDYGFFRG